MDASKPSQTVLKANDVVEPAVGVATVAHVTSTGATPLLPRSRTPVTVTEIGAGVSVPLTKRV